MKQRDTRWLSVLVLGILAVTLACRVGAPRDGGDQRSVSRSEGAGTVDVVLDDFSIYFEGQPLEAGRTTFVLRNEGSSPHDFAIRGEGVEWKTSMITPGESDTLTVDLEPGTYTYICTVAGHEQLGMRGELVVE